MLRVQDEHCSTPEAQPLTEEDISMMVLKPRFGYVKGLGMRPSSSLKTPASSSSTQYIQQLEGSRKAPGCKLQAGGSSRRASRCKLKAGGEDGLHHTIFEEQW